jgi:hypothetical protein
MNDSRETFVTISKAAIGVIFLLLLMANMAVFVIGTAHATDITAEKGLAISSTFIVGDSSPALTFSQIKQAHFTLIGTVAYSTFSLSDWDQLTRWITSAHAAGLTTFIDYWAKDENTAAEMTSRAASTGTDIVALDELLSSYHLSQTELQAVIDTGLKVNSNLQFILNEFQFDQIKNAYAWTAKYPSVRIATDNYYDKSIIDLGIKLGAAYGKTPAAWLIFSQGSQAFDSYTHLADWLAYAKLKNIDTYFWIVDKAGTWNANWQQVVGF